MEVTRENFKTVLESLPEALQKAQFIALDAEFTGLKVEGSSNINYFDTLEDLYLKIKLKAETFMAIQLGVTLFFYNSETNKYTHQGYNFYVFPSALSNTNFTCESGSIKFLVEHNFDFNKLFKHGIPYLKEQEVEQLLEKLEEKFDKNDVKNSSKVEIPNEHKETVNSIVSNVEEILKTGRKNSFQTDRYNSFVRRLIYNTLQQKFGTDIFIETNKDETMKISVGINAEEAKEIRKEKFLMQKKEILDEFGFSKVIKLIVESNKIIVGHNLFLDILFTIRQFIVPLPNNCREFKELVKFLFPKIIDTKYMAASNVKVLKDTVLQTVLLHFEDLNEIPEVEVAENGVGYKREDNKFHEASYDAFLTGLTFLGMCNYLGKLNCCSNIFKNLPESPILQPILNKVSTPKLCDIFYMNLGGCDNEPDRRGVYHLTFPMEWTRQNIMDLFKNCGFINISWCNSTSAFVKVKNEYISEVDMNLMNKDSSYKLMTYSEYRATKSDTSPSDEKDQQNSGTNSAKSDSPIKLVSNNTARKRKVEEDIGEVVERDVKKPCPTK